jgi:hypothetical protein
VVTLRACIIYENDYHLYGRLPCSVNKASPCHPHDWRQGCRAAHFHFPAEWNAVVLVTAPLPCPDSPVLLDMLFEPTSSSCRTSIASLWVVLDSGTEGRSGGSRSLQ